MPELPEVETIRRRLRDSRDPALIGRRVLGVHVYWPKTVALPSPAGFRRRIQGQRIRAVERRGKHLVFPLSRDVLIVHLRMSGCLILESPADPPASHVRLALDLEPGARLVFRDPRKFGRVWLTDDVERVLAPLGPEPLAPDFTARHLAARLASRRRQIKPLLLDQTFLAGLGNIYADESLYRAGIHPLRRSDELSFEEGHALWRAIRRVLREAIRHCGTTFDSAYRGGEYASKLRVYGQAGQACRRCGATIARARIGQRSTHFCPQCQTRSTRRPRDASIRVRRTLRAD